MTDRMTALVGGVGPQWEQREVDVPVPRPGQLLVRVRAAGLNRADLHMLRGPTTPPVVSSGRSLPGSSWPARSPWSGLASKGSTSVIG